MKDPQTQFTQAAGPGPKCVFLVCLLVMTAAPRAGHAGGWEVLFRRRPGPPPSVHFPGLPPPPDLGRTATKTGRLTLAELALVPDSAGGYRGERPGYRFAITPEGGLIFDDKPSLQVTHFYGLGVVGIFDVTDWLMRRKGDDPYRYDKEQIRLLTEPLRLDMNARARGDAAVSKPSPGAPTR